MKTLLSAWLLIAAFTLTTACSSSDADDELPPVIAIDIVGTWRLSDYMNDCRFFIYTFSADSTFSFEYSRVIGGTGGGGTVSRPGRQQGHYTYDGTHIEMVGASSVFTMEILDQMEDGRVNVRIPWEGTTYSRWITKQ